MQIADRCPHIAKRLLGRLTSQLCLAIMRDQDVDSFNVANAAHVADHLEEQMQHLLHSARANHQELLPVTEQKVKVHPDLALECI